MTIPPKIFLIKSLYCNLTCFVKFNRWTLRLHFKPPFIYNLFSVFIPKYTVWINKFTLWYADDLIVLSRSRTGLQNYLHNKQASFLLWNRKITKFHIPKAPNKWNSTSTEATSKSTAFKRSWSLWILMNMRKCMSTWGSSFIVVDFLVFSMHSHWQTSLRLQITDKVRSAVNAYDKFGWNSWGQKYRSVSTIYWWLSDHVVRFPSQ